jgi:hypothetical protein
MNPWTRYVLLATGLPAPVVEGRRSLRRMLGGTRFEQERIPGLGIRWPREQPRTTAATLDLGGVRVGVSLIER